MELLVRVHCQTTWKVTYNSNGVDFNATWLSILRIILFIFCRIKCNNSSSNLHLFKLHILTINHYSFKKLCMVGLTIGRYYARIKHM